jgi:cation:H+ antiporter
MWLGMVATLGVFLGGAGMFTNGVVWVGDGFGHSEGAVGSVLAAVGTALPETVLPLIAVLLGRSAGKEIGVGAILGAPLMLTTLAMFVLGLSVLGFARFGHRTSRIRLDAAVPTLDLAFFLGMFTLAIVAGLVRVKAFNFILAALLVIAYAFYVRRQFKGPAGERLGRGAHVIQPLYLRRAVGAALRRPRQEEPSDPPMWASIVQTLVGVVVIVAGARVFVVLVTALSDRFHVPYLAFALLVAPVATELPEIFNASVIWARRGRDTLAVGNITGAMVFQAVFPVTIGLTLTPWRLSGQALVAALVALGAGAVLFATIRIRGEFGPRLLLLQGLVYGAFVIFVLARI